ncbi:sugar transferase [Enemella evansiae]|uniref:glycosyltransferase family 2 protein n=1 Tax=Enemella evansiae TaxID=2016499 RepID=UPI000B96C5D4|nr:galactosyltransferase-related protein [Enemella evansiae]OYN96341.1 sugar transferase [Enemella evansiae]
MAEPAVLTLATRGRLAHLHNQAAALRAYAPAARHVVVTMGPEFDPGCGDLHAHLPAADGRLPLAAARNLAADLAMANGHRELVLLDVDCLPTPGLLPAYRRALAARPRALLCGPVSYLPAKTAGADWQQLVTHRAPHPARPDPPAGTLADGGDHDLFWSLSFACTAETWRELGGFCTEYAGYGGEDTDFGRLARAAGIDLVWVGGADAVHQWHPTSSPPWQHLDDILVNARIFHRRWGDWPMRGWLEAFEQAGALRRTGSGWEKTQSPTR